MIEIRQDMFEIMKTETHLRRIFCVTTNGYLKKNGEAVMGRGIAKQFKDLLPEYVNEHILGQEIKKYGNRVNYLNHIGKTLFFSFPVKQISGICNGSNVVSGKFYKIGSFVPGFHLKANLVLIENSAKQLREIVDQMSIEKAYLPLPGCGCGELNWYDVKQILEKYFDDRFIILSK